MPGFYTEEMLDDEWDELSNRKNFLDVIHNHLYPLLYQAWLKYKFSTNTVEFQSKKYWEIIFSLIGLSAPFRENQQQYGYLLKYSGILSQRSKSLVGLQTILNDYFQGVSLVVEPCVKRKVSIANKQKSYLGKQNSLIGKTVCIGQEIIDRTGKFKVVIGPIDKQQFEETPWTGQALDFIRSILKVYLVQPLEFSVVLLLSEGVLQPTSLGDIAWSSLGDNTWLLEKSNTEITELVIYES